MLSVRAILSVKVSAGVSAKAVGGFLRYVHYRDQHEPEELARGVEGLVRYVAYRDQASPQGRLFDRARTVGDRERLELQHYIQRSLGRQTRTRTAPRSVYRMVLSPEDARGLDLRKATRAVMAQLERDLGAELPPWIAAEHRNTAHPHVHIVMAAQREIGPGRYRTLVITRERLARMKTAMHLEIQRERSLPREQRHDLERDLEELRRDGGRSRRVEMQRVRLSERDPMREAATRDRARSARLGRYLSRLQRSYLREAERQAREQRWARGWERDDDRDRGWER